MFSEWQYYADRSGLTPKSSYSLTNHKRAYFIAQTGGSATLSMSDLTKLMYPNGERAYWATLQGGNTQSLSVNDIKSLFLIPNAAQVFIRIYRADLTAS